MSRDQHDRAAMSDERLDITLREFLDWQAEDLGGAPDRTGMLARVTVRPARRPGITTTAWRMAILALIAVALMAALLAVLARPPQDPVAPFGRGRITFGFTAPGASAQVLSVAFDGSDPRTLWPEEATWPVVSPDGTRVMLAHAAGQGRETTTIVSADGERSWPIPLPADLAVNLVPGAWSPEGDRVALDGWSETDPTLNGVWLANADGTGLTRLTHAAPGTEDLPVAWSPDGTRLLVVALASGSDTGPLEVVPLDGGERIRVTREDQVVWFSSFGPPASWAPDSASVAYVGIGRANGMVGAPFVARLDGSAPLRVGDHAAYDTGARYSPDGQWITYDRPVDASGRHQLFLVRPDGTDGRQLTTEATAGMGLCCATWSPDGGSLVFQGGPDATATLFTMALDATVATPLREEVGAYAQPAWR